MVLRGAFHPPYAEMKQTQKMSANVFDVMNDVAPKIVFNSYEHTL